MKDWQKVQGSQAARPDEIDTTTSAVVVYQRRNIERITVGNADGSTTELWQYDEREMTREEYAEYRADMMEAQIAANSAAIDDILISILEG